MVIFLVGLVSMILMRTLRKDYARYSKDDELDDMVRQFSNNSSESTRGLQFCCILFWFFIAFAHALANLDCASLGYVCMLCIIILYTYLIMASSYVGMCSIKNACLPICNSSTKQIMFC